MSNATINNTINQQFRVVDIRLTKTGYKTQEVLNFEDKIEAFDKAYMLARGDAVTHVYDRKGNLLREYKQAVRTPDCYLPSMSA